MVREDVQMTVVHGQIGSILWFQSDRFLEYKVFWDFILHFFLERLSTFHRVQGFVRFEVKGGFKESQRATNENIIVLQLNLFSHFQGQQAAVFQDTAHVFQVHIGIGG